MNTKRIIVLGFALVAASAAALLARGLMGGGTPKVEAKIAPPIAMSEVLVANSNIQPGLTLTPDMVRWQSWPASAVDASFITHAAAPSLDDAVKGTHHHPGNRAWRIRRLHGGATPARHARRLDLHQRGFRRGRFHSAQ